MQLPVLTQKKARRPGTIIFLIHARSAGSTLTNLYIPVFSYIPDQFIEKMLGHTNC